MIPRKKPEKSETLTVLCFPYLCGRMKFTISKIDNNSSARAGLLETAHGTIETPIFMPVGTLGTVKGMEQRNLKDILNAPIILEIPITFTSGQEWKSWEKPGDYGIS